MATLPKSTRNSAGPHRSGELALIDRIRRRALLFPASAALRVGIGDDCAVLAPPAGEEICVTTDFSLEGRHFRRDWHTPTSIGHRTLARGLSDLAAMGARPLAAFLSLALPRAVAADAAWLDGFLDGLLALAAAFGITLAGGDTAESPSEAVLADIVLLGSAPAGTALRRSGARPGDALYVTGTLGGAARELAALARNPARFSDATGVSGRAPHLFPQPRIAAGRYLREHTLASACIDLSDGLSTDLAHLCAASGVTATVDLAALPAARGLRPTVSAAAKHLVLHGGEDYELLFTARPGTHIPARIAGVRTTRIGTVAKPTARKPLVMLRDADGTSIPLPPQGWEHLR